MAFSNSEVCRGLGLIVSIIGGLVSMSHLATSQAK